MERFRRQTTQEPRLVYILRTFPELSETFVLREIQALRAVGVPVSILAIQPGSHADLVGTGDGGAEGLPPFQYLSRRFAGRNDRIPGGSAPSARVRQDTPVGSGSDNPAASGSRSREAPPIPPSLQTGPARGAEDPPSRADGTHRGEDARRAPGLFGPLARDVASLGGQPRRTARALRLAALARRAGALVPPGTVRLHAHFANDAAALARYVSALTGIPYRITAHAYDIYQDPFLLGANLAGAQRIYTVAHANLEPLRARAAADGWDPQRVSVLHCGIDLSAFSYREPAVPAPGAPARLLAVARLVPKKGLLTLLDALALLGRASGGANAAHLTIAGDGPQAGEIAARAAAPELRGRVTLLGAVPSGRARELMRDADLFVLPSQVAEDGDRDGLPVTLIEAMALGLPVLTTAVAGIPELVVNGTGRLVTGAGPVPLAEAIRAALAEPSAHRIEMTRRARRKVEEEFDLAAQVAALRP